MPLQNLPPPRRTAARPPEVCVIQITFLLVILFSGDTALRALIQIILEPGTWCGPGPGPGLAALGLGVGLGLGLAEGTSLGANRSVSAGWPAAWLAPLGVVSRR